MLTRQVFDKTSFWNSRNISPRTNLVNILKWSKRTTSTSIQCFVHTPAASMKQHRKQENPSSAEKLKFSQVQIRSNENFHQISWSILSLLKGRQFLKGIESFKKEQDEVTSRNPVTDNTSIVRGLYCNSTQKHNDSYRTEHTWKVEDQPQGTATT